MTDLSATPQPAGATVVFRADAAPALGGGHVMRCLTLAGALQRLGWHCSFAVNPAAPGTVPALADHKVLVLGDEAGAEPGALRQARPEGIDLLVVDHYGRDAAWETDCRAWANSILVIDDLADRHHDCDLLLDQTFGRRATDYAGLVPQDCRVLAGSDYALLRSGFAAARPASLARRGAAGKLQRLLVSLGATDPENYSQAALDGIAVSGLDIAVDVVLGAAAPHLQSVRARTESMTQDVRLHIDVSDMPSLMSQADLAIGAAGTSTWERCCLGLPSLMMVVAENQRRIAETVAAASAARRIPGPRDEAAGQIAGALRELATDGGALRRIAAQAAGICDGRGVDRVGLALATPGQAKDGRAIALRLATAADEEIILDWQRDPATRRFARNPAVPSAEEHHAWFTARLADPNCLLTVITLEDRPAGVLRLDPLEAVATAPETPRFEISILVDPACRGLGIGLEALHFARRWQGKAVIAATVLAGNEASAALFRAAGYQQGPHGLLYSYPAQSAMTLDQRA